MEKNFEELLKKIEVMKQKGAVDLSMEEDLSIAVMNLISLEEHFFFTGAKTGKESYFNLLDEVRSVRKDLMEKLIPKSKHEGETWCVAKHLLAATMRQIEVGTKLHADGKEDEAKEIFARAHKTYSLFWGLRLGLLDIQGFKKVAGEERAEQAQGKKPWTLTDIVDKLVDCCDE